MTSAANSSSGHRINRIELRGVLPAVFAGDEDSIGGRSGIWLAPEVVFERGCRVCIAAESGGGKSSMLSYIFGNRSDYSGTILFDGSDIRTFGVDRWCALRIGSLALLPQELRLFPELTLMENIALKNDLTGFKSRSEIAEMLGRLGIADKADIRAGRLSVGQQQRGAIVRTLCQPFDFVMLDEPVSHLDPANNRLVAEMVDSEASAQGAGVITTSVGNPLALSGATVLNL